MMRVLAIDFRAFKAASDLYLAKGYRDTCYHRTPERMAVEAAQLDHARAKADFYQD